MSSDRVDEPMESDEFDNSMTLDQQNFEPKFKLNIISNSAEQSEDTSANMEQNPTMTEQFDKPTTVDKQNVEQENLQTKLKFFPSANIEQNQNINEKSDVFHNNLSSETSNASNNHKLMIIQAEAQQEEITLPETRIESSETTVQHEDKRKEQFDAMDRKTTSVDQVKVNIIEEKRGTEGCSLCTHMKAVFDESADHQAQKVAELEEELRNKDDCIESMEKKITRLTDTMTPKEQFDDMDRKTTSVDQVKVNIIEEKRGTEGCSLCTHMKAAFDELADHQAQKVAELEEELRNKDDCIESMEEKITHLTDTMTPDDCPDYKAMYEQQVKTIEELSKKLTEAQNEYKKKDIDTKCMGQEITALTDTMEQCNAEQRQQLRERDAKIEELINKLNYNAEDGRTQKENYKRQLLVLHAELKETEEGKSRALDRLSKIASAQLIDGNPNITDLNDPNRPMKIAEKFSELYDNEWTDAFEEIERQHLQEKEIIVVMLDLLMTAFDFCKKAASDHLESMQQYATNPFYGTIPDDMQNAVASDQAPPPHGQLSDLPVEIRKQLKDIRKTMALTMIPVVQKRFIEEIASAYSSMDKTSVFIHKCVELCWLMGIQDPQLFLYDTCPKHSKFNKDFFRSYTKSGKCVDYLVWPALQTQENGSLLLKGVAQGC